MPLQLYKLEKCDISQYKEKIVDTFFKQTKNNSYLLDFIDNKTSSPVYLYWDKVKYKKLPKGISDHKELWALIKFSRLIQFKKTIIKNEKGGHFVWLKLPRLEQFLYEIDLDTGGTLHLFEKSVNHKEKHKFIARGLMDEAIASSQLEGANTTRKAAKKFLREGRKPMNESEQMILNNYQTMKTIEEEYKDKELSLELLLEMHSTLTQKVLPEEEQGKLRKGKDEIIIVNEKEDGMIYHEAPKINFVKKEIKRLIKFANDEIEDLSFTHPLIKAIMLHFWIGYLHPFTDGNGRLARALFYWYLLRKDYWGFAYLPISTIIRKSPNQYRMAYVYTEQDDLDLTYFIDYSIRKIEQAKRNFQEYVAAKASENKTMNKLLKDKYNFNDRQIRLLQYYSKSEDEYTSLKVHINIYQVSKATAIKDLKELEKSGFIQSKKQGRNVYYYATDKIDSLRN